MKKTLEEPSVQAPSTGETPNLKLQTKRQAVLNFGAWLFSGAWTLGIWCFCSAGTISSYPNTSTLGSNDLFIIERGPGVGNYNVQAYQLYQALSLFGLVASNLVDGPVPSGLLTVGTTNGAGHLLIVSSGQRWITFDGSSLSNVTAVVLASQGTNYGFSTARAFTNTLGRNLWVQMSNATATAVFNSLGTNVVPVSVNPSGFPLSLNMYFTNSAGGFFYYEP